MGSVTSRTNGKVETGKGPDIFFGMDEAQEQYTVDFINWMDGGKTHPCNVEAAYQGYETVEAVCASAVKHTGIDLPMEAPYLDSIAEMEKILPEIRMRKFPIIEE